MRNYEIAVETGHEIEIDARDFAEQAFLLRSIQFFPEAQEMFLAVAFQQEKGGVMGEHGGKLDEFDSARLRETRGFKRDRG